MMEDLLRTLTKSFSRNDLAAVTPHLADDFSWTLVGDETIKGKENFVAALEKMSDNKASELIIHNVVTQANEGAIHGEMLMEDGNRFGFSDFYVFEDGSELVRSITSYVVLMK